MVTRERRNKLMGFYYDLCPVRNVRIENASVAKHSFFSYMSPRDQLRRLLSDLNVFAQFLSSGKREKMYDHLGQIWHHDFFQSPAYDAILQTLPEDSDPVPPLLLDLYRLVI